MRGEREREKESKSEGDKVTDGGRERNSERLQRGGD